MNAYNGYHFEDLAVGQTATFAKTVTEADIVLYAGISGDTNPMHLNEIYASGTMFKGRIAHGMLSAGFISAVLGTRLPGPGAIYISQNLRFKAPVKVGDTVTAKVELTELEATRSRAQFHTVCTVGNRIVVDGDAWLMVPSRAA